MATRLPVDPTFYYTLDVDSARGKAARSIPAVPVLLSAASFYRKGFPLPELPAHCTDTAADSGGFVASFKWGGDYRFAMAEYAAWVDAWRPRWAAMPDYCCEDELTSGSAGVVRERQDKTTERAHYFWSTYGPTATAWVPTVQGWEPADYFRHAEALRPLIREMQDAYLSALEWSDDAEDFPERALDRGMAFRVGIGTLCRRASVEQIRTIAAGLADLLPGCDFHLWGTKLGLLRDGRALPEGVVSMDSAAWNGRFGRDVATSNARQAEAGLTQREYGYTVALPAYRAKVEAALSAPKQLALI